MKRRRLQRVVPAVIMAGATAVPVVTTAVILTHVPNGAGGSALRPSAPIAAVPPTTSSGISGSANGAQSYQGPSVTERFGSVQATITVANKKITEAAISAPQGNPRSASINQQAVPLLRSETLQAQSAQINGVSGATYTSQAYVQSLQGALDQARRQGNVPAATTQPAVGAQAPSVSVSGDD